MNTKTPDAFAPAHHLKRRQYSPGWRVHIYPTRGILHTQSDRVFAPKRGGVCEGASSGRLSPVKLTASRPRRRLGTVLASIISPKDKTSNGSELKPVPNLT